ncbi:hypothetical protein CROQUDRAFT_351784 [Cronartium quercuum f. sp. fusiforme G11]|uniref:Uncharacterized protein n=1 Tax=Cronartium quercuum f. sp. fusiforme G11 TaxID=708437 RepID=A0A9P6TEA5_9BASI|nr:hypothetical protein CROQUDRAFT_351784 [Cronartium quercuum f. sp. fusiforme G11]
MNTAATKVCLSPAPPHIHLSINYLRTNSCAGSWNPVFFFFFFFFFFFSLMRSIHEVGDQCLTLLLRTDNM